MRMVKIFSVLTGIALAVAGCGTVAPMGAASCDQGPAPAVRVYHRTLAELTYHAVDKIASCLPAAAVAGIPVIVSSLTDARAIGQSSTFGNILADFVRSRLTQNHMIVLEPRLRTAMLLKTDEGEMTLARDPLKLVPPPAHAAILTGTYAVGETSVFVSLKLIRVDTAQILAAADFEAVRSADIDTLLGRPAIAPR
jgi:hypothetical protein